MTELNGQNLELARRWIKFLNQACVGRPINSKQDVADSLMNAIPDETCPKHRKMIVNSVREFLNEE